MKNYKAIIIAVMIAVGYFSGLAAGRINLDGISYDLYDDGTCACCGCSSAYQTLVIPKTIQYNDKTYNITKIGNQAFYRKIMHTIIIPNTITEVGKWSFYGTVLDSLIIEDGDKNLDTAYSPEYPDIPWDYTRYGSFGGKYKYVYVGRACDVFFGYEDQFGDITACSVIDKIDYGHMATSINISWFTGFDLVNIKIPSVNILKSENPIKLLGVLDCDTLSVDRDIVSENKDYFSANYIKEQNIRVLNIGRGVSSLTKEFTLGNMANLTSLTIPKSYTNFDASEIAMLTNLEFLEIESGNPQCVYDNGMLLNNEQSVLYRFFANNAKPAAEVSFPELTTIKAGGLKNAPFRKIKAPRLTVVEDSAFYDSQLAELVTDNELTTVGEAAFYNCKISDIKLGDNIVDIKNNTFYNCENLSLDDRIFPKLKSVGDGAFHNCRSLDNTVKFDNISYIGKSAFCGTSIKSVEIDGPVTTIPDSVFANCTALESIAFGDNTAITEVGECGFMNCPKLSFGEDFIPGLVKIGAEAFRNTAITEVKLNEAVDVVYNSTFENCRKLTYADLGERVRSIGKDAFKNCDLRTVRLGSALRSVGDGAFNKNFNLENVYCNSTLAPEAYDNSFLEGYDATLHVPKGARQRYMIAPGWRYFASIVQDDNLSDVDEVTSDGEDIPAEYYDMQGRRVENPGHGIYIKRQGSKVEKVVL